jgi:hypothetical protein
VTLAVGARLADNVPVSTAVENILQQVNKLSPDEQKEFWDRVMAEESGRLDVWEKQVARDSSCGKLDHLIAELDEDIAAGRVKPLHEVIREP